jgi:hypothetical protein
MLTKTFQLTRSARRTDRAEKSARQEDARREVRGGKCEAGSARRTDRAEKSARQEGARQKASTRNSFAVRVWQVIWRQYMWKLLLATKPEFVIKAN